MEMALYEPGLGYYASDRGVIGKSGDYYTSPHLHFAFGSVTGRQIEEMWHIMGAPSVFHIIEIGAGAGYLCKDILDSLKGRDIFKSIRYVIVERSPLARKRHEKLLAGYADTTKWVSSPEEVGRVSGCILSNELLDSFPVHIVEMEDDLKEVYVQVNGEDFVEVKDSPVSDAIAAYLEEFSVKLSWGYRTEINLRIKDWLASVDKILQEGFIVTIDYGYPAVEYYSEDRNRGTLLCYHRHQVHENPYSNIGDQDLTAHVNFSSVKKWGEDLGIKTIGFCRQGLFLIALGIDRIINDLGQDSKEYLFEVQKIKGLILPGTMGDTHKVLIQYKGSGAPELKGFSVRNQAGRL
jgi:SAM-dependent MidA family methyltransferase